MAAFIVRSVDEKTILGLFVAPSLAWLWDSVDEVCDPHYYEWTRITNGALYCRQDEIRIPDFSKVEDDWENEKEPEALAMPSDDIIELFMNEDTKWTRFDTANVGAGLVNRIVRGHY